MSSVACNNSASSSLSTGVEAEKFKECLAIETVSEFLSDYQQQSLSKEEICKLIQVNVHCADKCNQSERFPV